MPHEDTFLERDSKPTSIKKLEESGLLREEIIEQIKLQQPLYLALLSTGLLIVGLALQPSISGLTACLLPLLGFSVALKIGAHDLRTGQLAFYLKRILYSPWEITRRVLWSGTCLSPLERQILEDQGIAVTDALQTEARKLLPVFPHLHSLSNILLILTLEGTGDGLLVLRTYSAMPDPLTVFVWVLALLCSVLSIPPLLRMRVR